MRPTRPPVRRRRPPMDARVRTVPYRTAGHAPPPSDRHVPTPFPGRPRRSPADERPVARPVVPLSLKDPRFARMLTDLSHITTVPRQAVVCVLREGASSSESIERRNGRPSAGRAVRTNTDQTTLPSVADDRVDPCRPFLSAHQFFKNREAENREAKRSTSLIASARGRHRADPMQPGRRSKKPNQKTDDRTTGRTTRPTDDRGSAELARVPTEGTTTGILSAPDAFR